MRLVVTVSLFALLLAMLAVSQVPDDKLIVPGVRIGAARLDMTIDDIIRVLGDPSQISDRLATILWEDTLPAVLYYWQSAALIAASRERVKVEYLMLNVTVPLMRTYRTDQGVARDTALEVLLRVYGQPTARTTTTTLFGVPAFQRFIYDTSGFFAEANVFGPPSELRHSVYTMGVFRPGEARNYWKF